MNEDVIFQGRFTLGPNYRTLYNTTLTNKEIIYETTSDKLRSYKISLDDVVGAKVVTQNDSQAFMHIYSYPLISRKFDKKCRRCRTEHVFCLQDGESFEENKATVEKWVKSINLATNNFREKGDDLIKLRFLVFINPFGGQGTALKLFNKTVKPMLNDAQVEYELKVTDHAGHARELVQTLDYKHLDCILCCSGDGLIHEVVNGLMARSDWKEAIKVPLGHIPCGSGNGLCAAALHHSREDFHMTSSVFTVLRGSPVPLDIVKVEMANSMIHYSFLGIAYGIIADVDVDSERYRYIGDLRFTLMGVKKIMQRQCFSGKVWYLPLNEADHTGNQGEVGPDKVENGLQLHQSDGDTLPSKDGPGDGVETVCDKIKGACQDSMVYLPNIQEPLPGTWKYIEGDFVGWMFTTLSHVGRDACMAPEAELGGGVIYGVYLTSEMTRKSLLDVLTTLAVGEHVNIPGVHVIKAKAIRFDPSPSAPSKNMTIDGELVDFGRIQAEIYKGLGRVRCR